MSFQYNKVSKLYSSAQGKNLALKNIDFKVEDHEFLCIVGPSGCGKTTLLKIAAGLDYPSSGSVEFDRPPSTRHPRGVMVFQESSLFPWMTVLDNTAYGLNVRGVPKAARHEKAKEFLGRVGLGDFLHYYPHQLSGGMRQRVAILRALLVESEVLLLDEPFGALDPQLRLVMQEELLRIWQEFHATIVYVTHDIEEAVLLADRIVVMSGQPGVIREIIPVDIARPRPLADRRHPEVSELRLHIWKMLENDVRKEINILP